MRTAIPQRIITLLLVAILFISIAPFNAFAEEAQTAPIGINNEESESQEIAPELTPAPSETPQVQTTNEPKKETATPSNVPAKTENTIKQPDLTAGTFHSDNLPDISAIKPIRFQTVKEPLIKITANYYDNADGNVKALEEYSIKESAFFYAGADYQDGKLVFTANAFPKEMPFKAETLKYRVTLDNELDITSYAEYNAETGAMTLPDNLNGHKIDIDWYLPVSEIKELTLNAKINVNTLDEFETYDEHVTASSAAKEIIIAAPDATGVSVSQNGVDLPDNSYSIVEGEDRFELAINVSPLGGDIQVNVAGAFVTFFSTNKTTITSTRDENQIYYGWYTKYYWADGNQALCLDPTVKGTPNGEYAISRYLDKNGSYVDATLSKIAYYGYGGPGHSAVRNTIFGSSWSNDAVYAYCHVAAAYVYMGNDGAFKGLGAEEITTAKNVVKAFANKPVPPDGFDAFLYNEVASEEQSMMGWDNTPPPVIPEDPPGNIEIIKTSSKTDMTNNNPNYSLQGAVFDVIDSAGTVCATVTTDANGRATATGLKVGAYKIVEKTAPKGFVKNPSQFSTTVVSNSTVTVYAPNTPQNDPIGILLRKKDASGNTQGGAGLAGAEFTVKYYKGQYSNASQLSGVSPERTWVFRTDAQGLAFLKAEYLVSGSPFYYGSNGITPTIPLGTITVQETKAPAGYLINNTLFVRNITSSTAGVESVFTYNEPEVPETIIRGGVSIQKWDNELNSKEPQGNATLQGAVFEIVNRNAQSVIIDGTTYANGAVVKTITTDANGTASTSNNLLPYGAYEIREKTAPTGYQTSGVLSRNFSITQDGVIVQMNTDGTAIKNNPIRGGVRIEKWDTELNRKEAQGAATLQGAVFDIYNRSNGRVKVNGTVFAKDQVVATITTDATGAVSTSNTLLPYGDYEIIERTAPTGYQHTGVLRRSFQIRTQGVVINLNGNDTAIKNDVIRGGVRIEKWDNELNRKETQGAAIFNGAVFEIYNRNAQKVVVEGKTYNAGDLVKTITTDENGVAVTAANLLPYGDYEIVEKTPPTGYQHKGVLRRNFKITTNGVIINMNTADTTIKNDVIRGGVRVEKWDNELNKREVQGDATLQGAVFEIFNRNEGKVLVNGTLYAKDQVVATLTTGADGTVFTSNTLLPFGTYEIIEKTAPTGYQHKGILRRTFTISAQGVIVNLNNSDTAIRNYVIRGGVSVEKWDNEIDEHKAQGGATFQDAVFEIVNRSAQKVLVNGTLYEVGEVVYTGNTDEKGVFTTESDLLPYGTYEVREAKAPEGYLHTGVLTRTFRIREQSVIVKLNTSDTAIKNNPIRGDLKGVKISDGDANRLAYVPFKITSLTTGESHIIVTDKNGQFDTSTSWNPHSQNTNRGETDKDGIWFGKPETLNDNLGALLYDTYRLEEQPCKSNEGMELLAFNVSIYKHNSTVDLGTLTDDYVQVPEIFTTALDKDTFRNEAFTNGKSVIQDTVYYTGLKAGREYTLKGVLMDKDTNEQLIAEGTPVISEVTFRAAASEGSVNVQFVLNTSALANKSVVVYETLEFDGKIVAEHKDMEDINQTVIYRTPEISTLAESPFNSKEIEVSEQAVIADTVTYSGLIPYETYVITGVLMDKETGEKLLIDGKEITDRREFTPEESDGTVETSFMLNTSGIIGKEIVVFETLTFKGKEIAIHKDITDRGQTVKVKEPSITTSAAGENGEKQLPVSQQTVIIDTVSYEGLRYGQKYTVQGKLMDKASGQPVKVNRREVTATGYIVPDDSTGEGEVEFVFDSSELAGKEVVVFEKLYLKDNLITAHEDLSDENQKITFIRPEIQTEAKSEDGAKTLPVSNNTIIIDKVSFAGLQEGQKYTLRGTLVEKVSGNPILINGQPVTSNYNITPNGIDGYANVKFIFDSTLYSGKEVVVYEELFIEDVKLSEHKDLNDEKQTVSFTKPELKTEAASSDGKKELSVSDKTVIIDKISFSGLKTGQKYIAKGSLIDKDTGEPLYINGQEVVSNYYITPNSPDGYANVKFTFDSRELGGKSVVVFEKLFIGETEIASHEDIDDANQTISFKQPEKPVEPVIQIQTEAKGADGKKEFEATEKAEITDTVSYKGLKAGEKYTVKGKLMDKAANSVLTIDGKEITAEKEFTPEKADGTIEVKFTFNAKDLGGKDVVVFEKLYKADAEIAKHEDINDGRQTVKFTKPEIEIGTEAKGEDGEKELVVSDKTVIVDSVSYKGLKIGEKYKLLGVLMDKETGKEILIDDKEVKAETEFTPEKPEGTAEVKFTFDTTGLTGKEIVVFEKLYKSDEEIAKHEDINDGGQTVRINALEIKTVATFKDGAKEIDAAEKITITDTVEFKGLTVGEKYKLVGVLMDKETEKPILIAEKEVTAETEFTPETADGSVEVKFTFNAKEFGGKSIVVFEKLYQGEMVIAAHEDIKDEGQTVAIKKVTTKKSPKTGYDDTVLPLRFYVLVGIGAALGVFYAIVVIKEHKERKKYRR